MTRHAGDHQGGHQQDDPRGGELPPARPMADTPAGAPTSCEYATGRLAFVSGYVVSSDNVCR